MEIKLQSTAGFTLIEVLVSMLIMAVVLGSLPNVFASFANRNLQTELHLGAMAAAQQVLEDYRTQDPVALPTSGRTDEGTITVNGVDYQAYTDFCLDNTFCTSVNNRHLSVEVNFRNEIIYTVESVFTRLD